MSGYDFALKAASIDGSRWYVAAESGGGLFFGSGDSTAMLGR